jgi:hypothetical protein
MPTRLAYDRMNCGDSKFIDTYVGLLREHRQPITGSGLNILDVGCAT